MRTERRVPWSVALAVVLMSAGVVALPDRSGGAPAPPPPIRAPCLEDPGTCLRTKAEATSGSSGRPRSGGGGGTPTTAARSGSGGGGGGPVVRRPSPAEIARQQQQQLLVEAETFLPQPVATTNPGAGRPSIVDVPTFFAVDNWLPPQEDTYTNGPWEITVYATPSLSVDPGEPGAPTIQCEDGGTRFDPDGPSPREQAARPGACAYSYTRRTGAAGRPEHWTAEVMVSWDVEWVANFPLPDDLVTFEVMTEAIEREVDEVQSIVESRG
jgi:hypothetical protein